MRKFIITLIILTLIILMAGNVVAQNVYHNLTIKTEGEYKFKVNTIVPQMNQTLEFEGVGSAYIESDYRLLTQDLEELQKWWSLF